MSFVGSEVLEDIVIFDRKGFQVKTCFFYTKFSQSQDPGFFHPNEIEKFKKIPTTIRKNTFYYGRFCAKQAVRKITGIIFDEEIEIASGIFDFPIVIHPKALNVQVSISHTNNAAIAIAFPESHPIGIDIEDISDQRSQTIDSQLSIWEKELRKRTLLSEAVHNTILWTAKESLGKILKTGLMVNQRIYEIKSISQNGEGFYVIEYKNFFQYKYISYIYQNSVIGLCIPKNSELDFARLPKIFL